MYAKSVIFENLSRFAAREGWMPEPHTLAEVEEFKDYISRITKADSNTRNTYIDLTVKLTKKRADEIARFVLNEQTMCIMDSSYWESRYAWICNEKGDIFKFQNNRSQEIFDQLIADFQEGRVSIELLILKARQLGMSTKTALKFIHRLFFVPYSRAIMASVKQEKSELMAKILEVCQEHQPWWLIPKMTTNRIAMGQWTNGSILSIQSGTQATGLAQGWTPTSVHISEIGDLPNPKKTIEEGLLRAAHSSRKLFLVLEGTGNGNTGWQADKWRHAKANWPKRESRLCPVFLNWVLATDLYPQEDWLRKFPIPEGWQPMKETREHILRCESYIRNTDYLSKIMGSNYRVPRHQQWYWEFEYKGAIATHTQKTWKSQMPADDIEALQGKNDTVFGQETIDVLTEGRKRTYQDYAITGNSVDEGFEPETEAIDYDKPRIQLKWTSHRSQEYEWTMIPLLPTCENEEDEEEAQALDRVRIFEEPMADQTADYTMGIDTADGLGYDEEDRSTLELTRSEAGEKSDVQVAELCSSRINAPQMVAFAACLATWYTPACKDPRGIKFVIEQRMRPGDDCQLQLKLMGFTWHHVDVSYDAKVVKENKGQKQGWYTREYNRHLLMDRYIGAVRGGWIIIHSRWLIEECRTLERKTMSSGKTRQEHQSGKHDDRVLASALSYFSRHALDVLADRAKRKYAKPSGKLPPVNYAMANTSQVSVGDW